MDIVSSCLWFNVNGEWNVKEVSWIGINKWYVWMAKSHANFVQECAFSLPFRTVSSFTRAEAHVISIAELLEHVRFHSIEKSIQNYLLVGHPMETKSRSGIIHFRIECGPWLSIKKFQFEQCKNETFVELITFPLSAQ